MSLEVGEHLPKSSAAHLVDSLAAASPLVLFSAAIPGQGGTFHVNEQWPEFWQALFAARGYRRLDFLRPMILANAAVEWWYKQNLYVFASEPALAGLLRDHPDIDYSSELDIVNKYVMMRFKSFRGLVRESIGAGFHSVRRRLAHDGSSRDRRRRDRWPARRGGSSRVPPRPATPARPADARGDRRIAAASPLSDGCQ